MTSSWPDLATGDGVLRGDAADAMPYARIDTDLRSCRHTRGVSGASRTDPRLLNPTIEAAFEEVATEVRTAARAEGFAAGWAQGRAAATAEVREAAVVAEAARQAEALEHRRRMLQAIGALSVAAAALESRALVPAEAVRAELLEGVFEIAQAVVGHEVSVSVSPGLDAVRRALDLAPRGSRVTVSLHPADRAVVAELMADGLDLDREVVLISDPSLSPGDAVADCDATRVDARLSRALERVREVLAP